MTGTMFADQKEREKSYRVVCALDRRGRDRKESCIGRSYDSISILEVGNNLRGVGYEQR